MGYLIVLLDPPDTPPPEPPAVVQVHHSHDEFPNPCAAFDNYAVRSGPWSDPATWANGIPGPADRVVLHGDVEVTQDDPDAQVGILYLMDSAVLRHDATQDTRLTFDTLILDDASEWLAHGATEADPIPAGVTCRLVKRDTPLPGPALDPKQFTGGILCTANSVVRLRGAPRTTDARLLRLAVEPLAGHTTLTFATAPEGWRPGDTLVIPPTDPYIYSDAEADALGWDYLFEEVEIASVAGAVVTLAAPLARDHRGAHDPLGELPTILPHAMNVTRNLRIESANPEGTRGHLMLAERCDGRLHHVGIYHFGRTRGSTLDSTTFAEDGVTVTHYGTNQVGRYALHRHHNFGPANLADVGWQGETVGCAFVDSRKWPITIHGTSYNRVEANNVYLGEHSLFSCEDGNEAYNRIEGNVLFGVWAPDGTADWKVSNGLWFVQPAWNDVVGNVAAGGRGSEYLPHGWHTDALGRGGVPGGTFVRDGVPHQAFPLKRGGDVMHGVEGVDWEAVRVFWTRYGEAAGNEFYALAKGPSFDHYQGEPGTTMLVEDTTCWACGFEAFFIYGNIDQDITLDGLTSWGSRVYGYTLNIVQRSTITLRRADIRCGPTAPGFNPPIGVYHQGGSDVGQSLVVEDGFVLAPTAVAVEFPATGGAGIANQADHLRATTLRNCTLANPAGQATPDLVRLVAHPQGQDSVVPGVAVRVAVYDHQGVPGDDFRLYFAEQAPAAIFPAESEMPPTSYTKYGALAPGLTNAESLADDGRCFGGELVPEGAEGPSPAGFPGAYKAPITD